MTHLAGGCGLTGGNVHKALSIIWAYPSVQQVESSSLLHLLTTPWALTLTDTSNSMTL